MISDHAKAAPVSANPASSSGTVNQRAIFRNLVGFA
jgi:hypothetical protein